MVSAQEIKFDLKQCKQDGAVNANQKEEDDAFDVVIKLEDLIAQSQPNAQPIVAPNQMTFGKPSQKQKKKDPKKELAKKIAVRGHRPQKKLNAFG